MSVGFRYKGNEFTKRWGRISFLADLQKYIRVKLIKGVKMYKKCKELKILKKIKQRKIPHAHRLTELIFWKWLYKNNDQ